MRKMPYDMHMIVRSLIMAAQKKSCSTCKNYDGKRYGNDNCFKCLLSLEASEYERRGS